MRIVCDNCGAKYQIGDDKVRNKVFKIRCKKCSHVIIVRSGQDGKDGGFEDAPGPIDAAAPPPAAPAAPSAPAPDAIWYVVVNREQVGPLTISQVGELLSGGEVDAETFTWAEGMPDWTRLGSVGEFAHLMASPEPLERPAPEEKTVATAAPSAPVQRSVRAVPAEASPFGALDGDEDVMVSDNAPQGGGGASIFDEPARSPRVSSEKQLRGQRNENSVLFSLDSLGAAEPSNRKSAGKQEGSGLLDISALAPAAPAAAPSPFDDFGAGAGFAPVSAGPVGVGMPQLVLNRKPNVAKIALIVMGVLLLVGGAVAATVILLKDKSTPETVAANTGSNEASSVTIGGPAPAEPPPKAAGEAPPKEIGPAAKPEVPAEAPVAEAPKPVEETKVADAGKAGKPASTKGTAKRRDEEESPRGSSPEDEPPAPKRPDPPRVVVTTQPAKPAGKSSEVDDLLKGLDSGGPAKGSSGAGTGGGPTPAPAGDPMLPETLTREQILRVVKGGATSVRQCQDKQSGVSVTIRMTIEQSGRVSQAKPQGEFAGTPVGDCVSGKVRDFRFPQFSGSAMTINMPFAL